MTLFRRLLCAAVIAFLPVAASAGERGIVANSGGQLKAEPKPKGKKLEKLKQGSIVEVIDHSSDGKWIKLSYQGPGGKLEGWVEKEFIRSMSRYGFSWERKDSKSGGTAATKAAPVPAATAAPAATPVPDVAADEPMEATDDGDWSNTDSTGSETTDAGTSDWGGDPAPDATPAQDGGDWGSGDATPTPAPAPAETDGTTEIDLTE